MAFAPVVAPDLAAGLDADVFDPALDPVLDPDDFEPDDVGRADGGAPTEPFAVVVGREPRAPEGRDAGRRAAGEVGRRAGTPRFCRAAPPRPGTVVGAPARTTAEVVQIVPR